MNPYPEKIPFLQDQFLIVREFALPAFDAPYHYHPEYEITCILESEGTRFVGDHFEHFRAGDLVFMGPDLPHYWHNNSTHASSSILARSVVIQFNQKFVEPDLIRKWNLAGLDHLLEKSKQGLHFYGSAAEEVKILMKELVHQEGWSKALTFLRILNILTDSKEYKFLSSVGFNWNKMAGQDNGRIDKVFKYVLNNFQSQISFSAAASLINMSESAFCHYFKKRVRKNFSDFVTELRLGHACKLLIESEKNIAEVCYASGFNNLSNFNRRFKRYKKISPKEFRKQFLKEMDKKNTPE